MRRQAAAEAEKQALVERFEKPSGVSDEERLKREAAIIQRAVNNGMTEVQVIRFPNTLCTDKGRAINQMEPGWENTLTGLPKEFFQFWDTHLRPRGYRLRCQIATEVGPVRVGLLGTDRENDKHDPYQPRRCWPWKVGASYAIDM
jgi:hypothetical protein